MHGEVLDVKMETLSSQEELEAMNLPLSFKHFVSYFCFPGFSL